MEILDILGKIGFDWQLAIANLVNFLLIYLVLKKFVFSPIQESIRSRRDKIEKGLSDAEAAQKSLDDAEAEKGAILENAKKEASLVLSEATAKANAMEEDVREKLSQEKVDMLRQAEQEIDRSERESHAKIAEYATDLVMKTAEKVVGEEIPEDMKSRFVSRLANK